MSDLPREISDPLRRYVLRRRRIAAMRAAALAALIAMLWLLCWGVVDRFIGIPAAIRVALLFLLMGWLASILIGPARAILRGRIDWAAVAGQLQKQDRQFGERLATVVSRAPSLAGAGSSIPLLRELQEQVESDLRTRDLRQFAPIARATKAISTATLAALMFSGLAIWPWLDLPRLLARQLRPLAQVQAATTARITYVSGNMNVRQGETLTIIAHVTDAGNGNVFLRTSTDGQPFTAAEMTRSADGSWSRVQASIRRDMIYEVRAGDAVSGPFHVRVLRPPIVRELRVRFIYPTYVNHPPLTITHAEGVLDAPEGTRAMIMLSASEPLRSAWFIIDGNRVSTHEADAPNSRQAEIIIDHDATVDVEMTSDRGAPGTAQSALILHAIPNRAPMARLMMPQGFSVLGPRSVLQVPYQSSDDYGLASLEARIEMQGKPARVIPLPLGDDPRQCQDEFKLDMMAIDIHVGQIASVILAATDRAGQTTLSVPWRILAAPESVDPEQNRRVAELRTASHLNDAVIRNLELARRLSDSTATSEPVAGPSRSATRIALASESATELARCVLRGGVGVEGAEPAAAIAALVDAAQVLACRLEQVGAESATSLSDEMRHRVNDLLESALQLQQSITTVWQALDAQIILIQRRNLAASIPPDDPDLSRLREELDTQVEQSGLKPRAPDLNAQLQARADALRTYATAGGNIDFAAAAAQWAESARPQTEWLWQRLAVAAQAETVRADADLSRARDLQLASQVVRLLDARASSTTRPSDERRRELLASIQIVLKHDLKQPEALASARQSLAIWAGETSPQAGEAVEQSRANVPHDAGDTEPSRERALDTIRRGQQFLAELPEVLANVDQAAQAVELAQSRLQDATRDLDTAAPEDTPAASRAVDAAKLLIDESMASLSDTAESLDPGQAVSLARELRDLGPDTNPAAGVVERQLVMAMNSLRKSVTDRDSRTAERLAGESRQAAATAQQALRQARQTILEHDPAVVARWFAQQAAATGLATQPRRERENTLVSMWDDPIQRAIKARMAGLSSQSSIFKAYRISAAASYEPGDRLWNAADVESATREPDPPALKEALDAYFQAIGQFQRPAR